MNDIDTLIRDRLADAAIFDVVADPRQIRASVARRQRRMHHRRRAAGALGALAVAGVAAGALLAVDRDQAGDDTVQVAGQPERESDTVPPDHGVDDVPTPSEPPRFLPAAGWEAVQVGAAATAANIPLGPATRSGDAPWDTVERLTEGDVVLYAISVPAGESTVVDAAFPQGELPLSIDDAVASGLEGQPDDVAAEALQVQVNGWNIDLRIFYGGTGPSAAARATAQEQLARLDVPPRAVRSLTTPPQDACQPSDLHASFDLAEATGMLEGTIHLRDIGGAPCTLEGRPYIELHDPTRGEVVPMTTAEAAPAWQQAGMEAPEGWPAVHLEAGSEAQAVLTVRNWCNDVNEAPFLFTRLPYAVDRILDADTAVNLLPGCEDPSLPLALTIGPFEPPPASDG